VRVRMRPACASPPQSRGIGDLRKRWGAAAAAAPGRPVLQFHQTEAATYLLRCASAAIGGSTRECCLQLVLAIEMLAVPPPVDLQSGNGRVLAPGSSAASRSAHRPLRIHIA